MIKLNCDSKHLKGKLLFDHPMSRFNTWRVGGSAECLFEPADEEDFSFFLKECKGNHPITLLGLGSNTLVRDGGIDGVVVILRKGLKEIRQISERIVRAGAGAACGSVARYCAAKDMQGLVFMAGIPGTVGGALKMNAGAFGDSTWSHVVAVEMIDTQGVISRRLADTFIPGYRSVAVPDTQWFVSADFELSPAKQAGSVRSEIAQLLRKRNLSQPTNELSCGSVFKNPSNGYAAELIERCGLKAYSIGDAQVSEKHANFIINRGQALAKDIEDLIEHIRYTVEEKTNVRLEPEVVIVGEMQ